MLRLLPLLLLGGSSLLAAQGAPRLQRLVAIGCADCGGPAEFAGIADVAVTPGGTIWVADREDPPIRVFSSSGRLIRSVGRRGQGPGEYQGIEKLFPAGDGSVAVVDMRLFRLTRVDTAGRLISTMSLKSFPFDAASAPQSSTIYLLFSRFQPGTSVVMRTEPGRDSLIHVMGPLRDFPRLDAPSEIHSLAVSPDGSVAVGNGDSEYRIRVFRSGRWRDLVRNIPRSLRTPEEIAEVQSRMLESGHRARAEGGQPSTEVPREKPHFAWLGLRYDSAGRLWVRTGRGDESRTVFDVFSPEGTWLGETVVPGRVTAFSLGGTYLVAAVEREDGVPEVTLWRIR